MAAIGTFVTPSAGTFTFDNAELLNIQWRHEVTVNEITKPLGTASLQPTCIRLKRMNLTLKVGKGISVSNVLAITRVNTLQSLLSSIQPGVLTIANQNLGTYLIESLNIIWQPAIGIASVEMSLIQDG